jgi:hypothetical protein
VATTTTTTIPDDTGITEDSVGPTKTAKNKKTNSKQTTANPSGPATRYDRRCSVSITCLSETRSGQPVTPNSSDVSPVTPILSKSTCEHGSSSSICRSLEPPTPVTATASTITIIPSQAANETKKRKRSTTTTTTATSQGGYSHYTKGRVLDQDTFSIQVDQLLEAASLPPTGNPVECERRADLAAFFLDWHLERAVEFAINDVRKKFRP